MSKHDISRFHRPLTSNHAHKKHDPAKDATDEFLKYLLEFADTEPSENTFNNLINDEQKLSSRNLNSVKGDINGDGELTNSDVLVLGNHLHGIVDPNVTLTDEQKQIADINGDGILTDRDAADLKKLLVKNDYSKIKINKHLKGDFNKDNKVDATDIQLLKSMETIGLGLINGVSLTKKMRKAADLNHDGILNQEDINILGSLVQSQTSLNTSEAPALTPSDTDIPDMPTCDLNIDGITDYKDLEILGTAVTSYDKNDWIPQEQHDLADLNKDGIVDAMDAIKLSNIVTYNSLISIEGGSEVFGDINNDGIADKKDEWILIDARDLSKHGYLGQDQIEVCDLNKDGVLDVKDINILRYDVLNESKPNLEDFTGISNPKDWFISQSPNSTNTSPETYLANGDCGAACAAMIGRIFGKLGGGAAEAHDEIELMRIIGGASPNTFSGMSLAAQKDALDTLGLNTEITFGLTNTVSALLKKGKKLILSVDPSKYSPSPSGPHAIVVTGMKGNKFEVYDPRYDKPIYLSAKALGLAMNGEILSVDN